MNRNTWIGLLMVAASYGQLLVPKDWAAAHHFAAGGFLSVGVFLFAMGVIFLGEGVSQQFGGKSLIGLARGNGWNLARFLVVGAATGLLAEIFAQWLGKLWYYPYYPTWFYWPSLVASFLFYWVMIVESYFGVKAVLDRYIKWGGREKPGPLRYYGFEHTLYMLLGAAGVGALVFGLIEIFFSYEARGGGYTFNALGPSFYAPPLRYILLCFAGVWSIGEAVLYTRGLPSLLRSIFHGYVVPALSLAGASVLTSVIWESQNAQVNYWVYEHWPYPHLSLFHVQLSVLATWPANYVVYLIIPAAIVASWAPIIWSRPTRQKAEE